MTYGQLVREIKSMDADLLGYWSGSDLTEMGVQFRTLDKAQEEGLLTYVPLDDMYMAVNTYQRYEADPSEEALEMNVKFDRVLAAVEKETSGKFRVMLASMKEQRTDMAFFNYNMTPKKYENMSDLIVGCVMQRHGRALNKGVWFTGSSDSLKLGQEIKLDSSITPSGAYRVAEVDTTFPDVIEEFLLSPEEDKNCFGGAFGTIAEGFGWCESEPTESDLQEAYARCVKIVEDKKIAYPQKDIRCRCGTRLF